MRLIHISVGGPDRKITDAQGKAWVFEDHPRFGPIVLKEAGGEPDPKQPGERSPFWKAWNAWKEQGKRLAGDVCVWDSPAPCVVEHIAGQHYRVISGSASYGAPVVVKPKGAS